MKRWDWTWEEPRSRALPERERITETPDPAASAPAGPPRTRSQAFRRRRAGAVVVLVVLIALVVLAAGHRSVGQKATSGGGGRPAASRVTGPQLSGPQRAALAVKAEEGAIDRVLSYAPAVTAGGSQGNEVALTFDDGPGPYTERLVKVLNSLHVHATFFAIGEEERYFSPGTLLELRSGDVVGDHTETHPMLAAMSAHDQYEELFEQIARIELLDGPRPRLFRPPYGSFNATTFKLLRKLRLLMVLWSTDTDDYTLPGVQAIVQSALAGAHPGAIILMHDAGGDRSETVAALPAIIAGLRKRGLRPVTVPRLMLDDPPPRGQPIPKSLAGD